MTQKKLSNTDQLREVAKAKIYGVLRAGSGSTLTSHEDYQRGSFAILESRLDNVIQAGAYGISEVASW